MLWNRISLMKRVLWQTGFGLSVCVAAGLTGCDKVENIVNDAKKEIAEQTAPPTPAPANNGAVTPNPAPIQPAVTTPTRPSAEQVIAQFKSIKPGQYTDSMLAELAAVPEAASQITELNLSGSQGVSGAGLAQVAKLPNLTTLTIMQSGRLTAEDFAALKDSNSLTTLDLSAGVFNAQQMAAIGQIPNLESVVIANSQVDGASVAQLAAATKLAVLDANNTQTDDSSIAALKACPLRVVKLIQTRVTDATVLALGAMPTIEEVVLIQCQVTGKAFQKAAFANLKKLDVAQTNFGPDGLIAIKKLKKLERLGLFSCGLTLDNGTVVDTRLNVFKGFPELKELVLAGNGMTSLGVANMIAGHKSLEVLHLNQLRAVGDPGIARLVTCPNLKELHVTETAVSQAGAAALKAKLPNLTVFGSFGKL